MVFLSRSLQSKECLSKPNLLQQKLCKFARNIRMSFRQLLPARNPCDVLVKCNKTFFVESHRKSKQHQRKLKTKSKSQSKQTFLQLDQVCNILRRNICFWIAQKLKSKIDLRSPSPELLFDLPLTKQLNHYNVKPKYNNNSTDQNLPDQTKQLHQTKEYNVITLTNSMSSS